MPSPPLQFEFDSLDKIMTCAELGLPPVISKLASLPRGLVLVTGPTGSGKSTIATRVHEELTKRGAAHSMLAVGIGMSCMSAVITEYPA